MLRGSSRTLLQTARNASITSAHSRQLINLGLRSTSSLAIRNLHTQQLVLQPRKPLAIAPHSLSIQQTWRRYASNTKEPKDPKASTSEAYHHTPSDSSETATTSTTRSILGEVGEKPGENKSQVPFPHSGAPVAGAIVGGALASDLRVIKDTFALKTVPREAYILGFAGLIPYLTTSLATVYCAWDVHYAHEHGTGFIINEDTATWLLTYLEPLQVGYGAVILSFLGAIHWGLEWAKYGGEQKYRRYSIGVIAPAIAWPTVLLPYEYALISQFLGFTYLYYADAAATTRGWAPPWYSTYRFVLTFLAGLAIVISLVGKSEVSDVLERRSMGAGSVTDPTDKIVSGVSKGDRRLASYEASKAEIWDKKEDERKEKEEEEAKKKEEEEKKNKTKGKKGGDKKAEEKEGASDGDDDSEGGDDGGDDESDDGDDGDSEKDSKDSKDSKKSK